MTIEFPIEEHTALQERLATNGFAYTTRVSAEVGKYRVGQILETPWGRRVRVSEVVEHESIDQHPHLNELTEDQKETIKKYGSFEYIKLDYV